MSRACCLAKGTRTLQPLPDWNGLYHSILPLPSRCVQTGPWLIHVVLKALTMSMKESQSEKILRFLSTTPAHDDHDELLCYSRLKLHLHQHSQLAARPRDPQVRPRVGAAAVGHALLEAPSAMQLYLCFFCRLRQTHAETDLALIDAFQQYVHPTPQCPSMPLNAPQCPSMSLNAL